MTKRYLAEIENLEQIRYFDAQDLNIEYDNNGSYFVNPEDWEWWNEIADAMQYLEDNEIEYDEFNILDYDEYVTVAKEHGFNSEEMKNKNYTREDIMATYADDFNEFIEIEFINHDILRVNYRDLPRDINNFDDNFELSKNEFKQILQDGEWR